MTPEEESSPGRVLALLVLAPIATIGVPAVSLGTAHVIAVVASLFNSNILVIAPGALCGLTLVLEWGGGVTR